MAVFEQQNNSKDNKNSVNTRGIQFFNKESKFSSTLSVGYWNGFISIKINPALPKEQQSEMKVYDYTKSIITTLDIDKASTLINEIETVLIPAMKENKSKTISVPTSMNSLLTVGVINQGDRQLPYIAIHKNIKDSDKRPELSIFYEFNTLNIIEDYNENTGEYQIRNTHSELLAFIYVLKAAVDALSHAHAHSSRYVGKWNNDKIVGMIEEISSKLNISSAYTNRGSSYNKGRNLWETGTANRSTDEMIEQESLENIDDLNEFLR